MSACPCGGPTYETCCGPRHDGTRPPETAEALMRSRYAAFTRADVAYLQRTHEPPDSSDDLRATEAWARSVTWLGLEVRAQERGGPADEEGFVTFTARYLERDEVHALTERSRFVRREGAWRYLDGAPTDQATRVERNAPCPCGSGRKFKQCHA